MRRISYLSFVLFLVVGLMADFAVAQRGGRGGRGGARSPATKPRVSAKPSIAKPSGIGAGASVKPALNKPDVSRNINPGQLAFSPGWYAAHPNAWRATHPHADAYLAATAAGLSAWLAWPAAVYTTTTVLPPSQASALANQGESGPNESGEWMNLGVYEIRDGGKTHSGQVFQLSINHDGYLRGSSFQREQNQVAKVTGAADKNTGAVAWTVEKDVFSTSLAELTKGESQITIHAGDKSATAKLVRLRKPTE